MRRRIKNAVQVEVDGATLEGASDLEFYIRQKNGTFFCYTPRIVDNTHIEVEIPFEDAMKLRPVETQIQLAFVNSTGYPTATDTLTVTVSDLLKEDGYDH
jgi:hypothetical protein